MHQFYSKFGTRVIFRSVNLTNTLEALKITLTFIRNAFFKVSFEISTLSPLKKPIFHFSRTRRPKPVPTPLPTKEPYLGDRKPSSRELCKWWNAVSKLDMKLCEKQWTMGFRLKLPITTDAVKVNRR